MIKLPNLSSQSTEFHHLLFCAASIGIDESNRMQYGSFRGTNISKLNFASGRTGRTAGPASNKRKNLYQVALLSIFYKGEHGGLIIQ